MAAQDHDQNTTASPGLRPNRNDPLHDLQRLFANTPHNDSAARDAYVRQGAQTGGALVGTAVGAGTTVAVGASTGGTAVLRPSRRSALLKTSYSQRTSRTANCPLPTTLFRKEGNQ